jgi:hypothetical protein
MHSIARVSLIGAVMCGLAGPVSAHTEPGHTTVADQPALSAAATKTAAAMRDLWVGHIFWVRNVVFATLSKNSTAAKAAETQAVANAKAIAAAVEPFYGAAARDALFKLLAGHYGAIKAYLVATAGNDASGKTKATDALTKNAEAIAVFLSGANPNLPKNDVYGLLLAHGGHHVQQIQQVKDGKYEAEAATWEEMKNHMFVIADALTAAIAKQFPNKF